MQKIESRKKLDGVSRRPKDDNFFAELEKQKRNFSSFWVLATILLLIIFSTLIFSAVKVRRLNLSTKVDSQSEITESFSDRVSSIHGYGLSTMSFTGLEFVKATGADVTEFPLKNSSYEITKDEILLRGKLKDSFIPLTLKIKIIPGVNTEKKFSFLIAPNSVDNILIYGQNKEKIELIINKSLNDVLDDNGLIASAIETSDDKIELKVIKEPK
ncbi:MAG: hypothetical protein WC451_00180 [Patescibacteria group bacterium]